MKVIRLIVRVRRDSLDNKLIEEWFELYEKDVTSYLVYYMGTMDVEDLVQETFLRALRETSKYKASSHPKTWLISIARNLVIDQFRRGKVWSKIRQVLLREQTYSLDMEQQIILTEAYNHLYKVIYRLPSRHREVIILKGIMEMSSKEVSRVIKSSENNVNVMYHRALKQLKSLLEMEGDENGGI